MPCSAFDWRSLKKENDLFLKTTGLRIGYPAKPLRACDARTTKLTALSLMSGMPVMLEDATRYEYALSSFPSQRTAAKR
jgi:hypothetical protein